MQGTYKIPLRECIKIKPRGYGWITDGYMALQTKAMKKVPKYKYNGAETKWSNFRDCVLKGYAESIQAWPRFYHLDEWDCKGVSNNPVPCENPKHCTAVVWIQSAAGKWQMFNQHRFNYLREIEPDFYMVVNQMVIAVKDNQPVGGLMAIRTENLDHALNLAKEANLI